MSKKKLSEHIEIQKKGINPAAYPQEYFYYYTLPNFDEGEKVNITQGIDIGSNKFIAQNESVLISKLNPRIKRVWLLRDDENFRSISSTEFIVIEAKESSHIDFLYYFLQSDTVYSKLESEAVGTTNSHVRFKSGCLYRIEADFPAKPQQQKIAEILATVDRMIAHTEALIEKYQQIKAGLMHDLFTRGIGANGKLRPLREQAPELYQESAIGWIPKEWGLVTLDAIKESLVDGPFGSNLKTEHYVFDPGVRVVRLQNIRSTKYDDKDKAFISDKHADFLSRNKVLGNDILIAGLGDESYPVGRACLYPEDLPSAINKADCFRFRCTKEEMNNGFAMYFLNTSAARLQARKYAQGVTRSRINLGNIKKIAIPKPSPDEQLLICEKLDGLEHRIDKEICEKEKLKLQKSGLMHDLLTGKAPVNVDLEEVAHV